MDMHRFMHNDWLRCWDLYGSRDLYALVVTFVVRLTVARGYLVKHRSLHSRYCSRVEALWSSPGLRRWERRDNENESAELKFDDY